MMETLPEQFSQVLNRIQINGPKADRAQEAHKEVRRVLEGDAVLREWGIDTVLIGSYGRKTGIYPGNDVDVFSKLTALSRSASPETVFERVAGALDTKYGSRATRQDRSVKVVFSDDGFSVDAVPAVHSGTRWAIPNRDRTEWTADDGWCETDPERLSELTILRNEAPAVSGRGAYVPIVKLVRQTREHHLGKTKPGGLYFEMATYWAFETGVSGSSFAEIFAETLGSIASQLARAHLRPLLDPAMLQPHSPQPSPADLATASGVFGQLASEANRALDLALCPAAAVWRHILGSNSRGPCFPLPPNCDEKGRSISRVTTVSDRGSDEARPFG